MVAFLSFRKRMSAAAALKARPRDKANVIRFLQRQPWAKNWVLLHQMAQALLAEEKQFPKA